MRYVDSLIVAITAIDNFVLDGNNFTSPDYDDGLCGVKDVKPWAQGAKLLQYILDVSTVLVEITKDSGVKASN